MIVRLTWPEVAIGARIGESKTIKARANNGTHRHAHDDPKGAHWTTDIEAACAEVAAAKAFGVYMPINPPIEVDRFGDLGYGLHVRHTEHPNGKLILHRDDIAEHFYICVRGSCPVFDVAGVIKASDGQREEFWEDPTGHRPAFFVPVERLHRDIAALRGQRLIEPPPGWADAYTPPKEGAR